MKFNKKNGLYLPDHYMGCMGIEDQFPFKWSKVTALRKGVKSPSGGGGTTGGSAGSPPAGGYEIDDNFSSDTSGNYTKIIDEGGVASLEIAGGVCTASVVTASRWFHETALSSPNHYVQATVDVGVEGDPDYGDLISLIVRSDGTSGATADYYYMERDGSTFDLYRVNNASGTYLTSSSSGMTTGTYTMRMEANGTGATVNIKVIWNSATVIDYNDEAAGRLTSGSYVGMRLKCNSVQQHMDNFIADNI